MSSVSHAPPAPSALPAQTLVEHWSDRVLAPYYRYLHALQRTAASVQLSTFATPLNHPLKGTAASSSSGPPPLDAAAIVLLLQSKEAELSALRSAVWLAMNRCEAAAAAGWLFDTQRAPGVARPHLRCFVLKRTVLRRTACSQVISLLRLRSQITNWPSPLAMTCEPSQCRSLSPTPRPSFPFLWQTRLR
jgi:hypothetical protein